MSTATCAWEFEALASDVRAGKLNPVYVLAGPDTYQKSAVLNALRAKLTADGNVDEVHIDGRSASAAGVVAAARATSLLGRRLVVVDDAPWVAVRTGDDGAEPTGAPSKTAPKEPGERAGATRPKEARKNGKRRAAGDADPLVRYVSDPNQDSVVVLRSETLPDARLALVRASKVKGGVLAATCRGRERELAAWCARRARERGASVEPDAARLLAWRCPADMGALDQEIDKLTTAAEPVGGRITAALVEEITPASCAERVWSVVEAVAERRPRKARTLLHQLLEQGENPVGVLALLASQTRELSQARRAVQQRRSVTDYAREHGIEPWRAERLLTQARFFRHPYEFINVLETLWGAELAIKTGWSDPETITQTAVVLAAGRVRWAGPAVDEEAGVWG